MTRIKSLFTAVVTLGLVAGFAPSRVEAADFISRCSGGSLRTCASFQLETVPLLTGGVQAFLRVRNDGARAGNALWGQLLTSFAVMVPGNLGNIQLQNRVNPSQGAIFTEGGAVSVGSPSAASYWRTATNLLGNQIDFLETTLGVNGGVRGCVRPNNPQPSSYFRTCANNTPTGWVTFAFTTSNSWNAADAEIAWAAINIGDGNNSNGTEGNHALVGYTGRADATAPPTVVTPEPATMLLLATGLAGIAGVRSRRRKSVANPDA